jgi:hypothetical protein
MDKNLITGMDHGAVVETHMCMQAFEAVTDFDGAGHLLLCF